MERVSHAYRAHQYGEFRSMTHDSRYSTVGPWAEQKLRALDSYLEFYMKVMKRQKFDLMYVDAFAGTPRSIVRNAQGTLHGQPIFVFDANMAKQQVKFIEGSPIRALKFKFDKYYFFDLDELRISTLNSVCKHRSNVVVKVGDCNSLIDKVLHNFVGSNVRGVALLDPYGPHLHWDTLVKLAQTKNMEVIINFPISMAINRLITKDASKILDTSMRQLDQCFGTREWYNECYYHFENLFGEMEVIKHTGTVKILRNFYFRRLKKHFRYVMGPRLIYNTRGSHLYDLIWAGQNHVGARGAQHIFDHGKRGTIIAKEASREPQKQLELDLDGWWHLSI